VGSDAPGQDHNSVGSKHLDVDPVPRPESGLTLADDKAAQARMKTRATPDRTRLPEQGERDLVAGPLVLGSATASSDQAGGAEDQARGAAGHRPVQASDFQAALSPSSACDSG
jgi:hypothetical protein